MVGSVNLLKGVSAMGDFISLAKIAEMLAAEVRGDSDWPISGLSTPHDAQEQDLIVLMDLKYLPDVMDSRARAVLLETVPDQLLAQEPRKHLLIVPHVRPAFAHLLRFFYPAPMVKHQISPHCVMADDVVLGQPVEISPFVVIESGVQIGSGTRIGAHVQIGRDSVIGKDCQIGANVSIADQTIIGDRVVIHAGSVIGSDGYGFFQQDGQHHKTPQVGKVIIQDDVEIGANVCIDRATLGATVIGEGSKIDNLVQIGHNVQIGKRCLLVSQVGISGSSQLGDDVTLAGQTGVAGHLKIGHRVIAAGKSGITRDIPDGLKVSGFPAQDHVQELRQQAKLRRLLKQAEF